MAKDKQIKKIKQHGLQRRLAVSLAGARSGARLLGSHAGSVFQSSEQRGKTRKQALLKEAKEFAGTLGELKGAYVKIGQMMALYGEHLLPPEITTALHELDHQTASMRWSVIEPEIRQGLAKNYPQFDIEQQPIAAASLSQVHRAIHRRSGRHLALKVQYPGVANTIESDFRMVIQLLKLARWVQPASDMEEWMLELQDMLIDEVDYQRELKMTRKVAALLQHDERFLVPAVYPRWSGGSLLTMDYLHGFDVNHAEVQKLSLRRRNELARAMLDIFFREVFVWGIMQTDPNFGNFRVQLRSASAAKDKLVLLDFGAVRKLPASFIRALRQTIIAAYRGDRTAVIAGAIALKCLQADQNEAVKESFADFCVLLMEPFRKDKTDIPAYALNARNQYVWHQSRLLKRVGKLGAQSLAIEGFEAPPKEFALIARKLTGVFTFVAALRAELNAHKIIEHYL